MSSGFRKRADEPQSKTSPADTQGERPNTPADWLFLRPEIIDQLHDSIIVTDLKGKITGCNQAALRMFGYTQEELIGQNVEIFYPVEDRESNGAAVFATVMAKGQVKTEQRNKTKSGSDIYIQLTISLLRDPAGNPNALVGISKDITERKLTEMALRQSDQRFHALTQVCPDFFFTTRADGWTDYASGRFYEFTGAIPGGAEGLNRAEYLHPDDRSTTSQAWMDAVKTGEPFETKHRFRGQDGNYRWFQSRAIPIKNNRNEVERWVGIGKDIDLQTRTENALHESEERFKAIFNQTFQFIGLLSTEGILLEANETALTFGGLTRHDVIGLPFWEAYWWGISEDAREQLQDAIKRAARGEFVRYAVEVWDANRTAVPIDFTLRPIKNQAGEVVLLIPEGHDLRELKQAEAALKDSEKRFKKLAEAIPHSVWVTSDDGSADYSNQHWLSLTGMSMEQSLGQGWVSAIHPDDAQMVTRRWGMAVALNQTFEAEYRVKTADGSYRWQLARALPHKKEDGAGNEWFGTCTDIHDHKMAMKALEEREATLRNFYDHSPFAMGITELRSDDVLIVYGNPATCAMYGLGPGGTSGYTMRALGVDRQELDRSLEQHRKCMESGKPELSEYPRGSDGERRWYRETVAPLDLNVPGSPRFTFVAMNITAQKLAEEALSTNEERFQLALRNSPVVAFHQDKELRYTWIFNPRQGYTPDDVIGKRDSEIFENAADALKTEELKRNVLETGRSSRSEVCVHHAGEPGFYDLTVEPLRNAMGEIEGVSCTATDVTIRKEAEEAFRQQQLILETLIESSSDYIYMKDREGRYVFINSAAARSVGKLPQQIIGKDDTSIFPPEHAREIMKKERLLMDAGTAEVFEETHPTVNGLRHMQTSKGVCRDARGAIIGVVGITRDVTEARSAEQALQAIKIAEAAAQMGHALAHEINNPLAALTNSLYLLQHGSKTIPNEQMLNAAQESLTRITTITRQVIGLYRQKGTLERVRVQDLVEDVLSSMDLSIRSRGITFEKRLNPAEFHGVEADLRQLISALLENAVEKSRGQVKIRLYASKAVQSGFRLVIADNGPGIPLRDRQKVFEPFFSTKEKRGSGLGLWIAKRIAEKYSGAIRLRSRVAGASGTCVVLNLPLMAAGRIAVAGAQNPQRKR